MRWNKLNIRPQDLIKGKVYIVTTLGNEKWRFTFKRYDNHQGELRFYGDWQSIDNPGNNYMDTYATYSPISLPKFEQVN